MEKVGRAIILNVRQPPMAARVRLLAANRHTVVKLAVHSGRTVTVERAL